MRYVSSVWDRLAIGTLCGVLGLHILWILLNHAPVAWDSASHTWISMQILSSLQRFDLHGVLIASNYYPIFIHTVTALILAITGAHIVVAQYAAVLYFGLTLIAIYLYTSTCFQDRRIAFFTSLFFAFFPIVADQAHWLMLDVPLTGLLFFTLYLFERTCMFTKRKATLWFFVSLGFLIMTKWTGVLFLLFPILFRTYKELRNKNIVILSNSGDT